MQRTWKQRNWQRLLLVVCGWRMEVAKSNLLSLQWSLPRRSWGCLTEDSDLAIYHGDEAYLSVRVWCSAGMEHRDSALMMKSRQHYVVYHDRDGQVPWAKWLTTRCKARLSWRNLTQDGSLVSWAWFKTICGRDIPHQRIWLREDPLGDFPREACLFKRALFDTQRSMMTTGSSQWVT